MITLSIDLTEEQAEDMVADIQDSLDEGDEWNPELTFQRDNAEMIEQNLSFQIRHGDHYYNNL